MHQDDQAPSGQPHIFAVDGSPDFLDVLRDLFEEEHYRVTTTSCTPQTFDQIAVLTPSLLLIDVAAGEHLAWALLERLGNDASLRRIPTIILSTSPRLLDEAREHPHRAGGQRFLCKPLDLDDLLEAVEALLGPAPR